jgi:hypothetical protein
MFSSKLKRSNARGNAPRQRQRNQPQGERQKPVIFSYHARRNDNHILSEEDDPASKLPRDRQNAVQTRTQKNTDISTRRRLMNYLIAGVALVIVGFELILYQAPQVIVTGDKSATIAKSHVDAYQQTADKLLSASLSSHTKPTINTALIDSQLLTSYPELASASTTVPFIGNRATVTLVPAQAVLADVLVDRTVSIDSRGIDITDAHDNSVSPSLPKVMDRSGTRSNPGHTVLPSSTVRFIMTLIYQLHSQSITVTTMVLADSGSELDVSVTGRGYFTKFNLQTDPRLQAGTLAATLKSIDAQHITPTTYIDVRLAGRIYYK